MLSTKQTLALIGVPTNSSGKTDGVARMPQALRQVGLVNSLEKFHAVEDYGDVAFLAPDLHRDSASGITSLDSALSMISGVRQAVFAALEAERFPVVIGGDCPALLGALQAVKQVYSDPGLVFIDGHEDAYAPRQSPTGEMADMELGLALGLNLARVPNALAGTLPLLRPADVVLVGARDRVEIEKSGGISLSGAVKIFDDASIQQGDITEIAEQALKHISAGVRLFWLHIDLDCLSSDALAAVDYPQPGGLSWTQLESISYAAVANPMIAGIDVTIYNPDLDPSSKEGRRIVDFLSGLLGNLKSAART